MPRRTRLALCPLEAREVPTVDIAPTNVEVFANNKPATVVVPGDEVSVRITVQNFGEAAAHGNLATKVYLSTDAAFDADDRLLGTLPATPIALAPVGGRTSVSGSVKLPKLSLPTPEVPAGQYYLVVEVDSNLAVDPGHHDNNYRASATPLDYRFLFGRVGERDRVALTTVGGTRFSLALTKFEGRIPNGTGELLVSAGGTDLTLTGTTSYSDAKATGGSVTLHDVTVPSSLAKFEMPAADVTHRATFPSGVHDLILHDLGGAPGAGVTIGAGSPAFYADGAELTFTRVHDASIQADAGVGTFTAGEWKTTPGYADTFTAPFVKHLNTKMPKGALSGDFDANVTLAGPAPDERLALSSADIRGTARGTWTVADAKTITVQKAERWQVSAAGLVNELTVAGDWDNTDVTGLTLKAGTIGTLVVKGILNGTTIEATGTTAKTDLAIRQFAVNSVAALDTLTAAAGGIGLLGAVGWRAETDIKARWVRTVLAADDFAASLELTATAPDGNYSLRVADIGGTLGGDERPSQWKVFADVGSIRAGEAKDWKLTDDFGPDSPGAHLGELFLKTYMLDCELEFRNGAGSISGRLISKSKLTTGGEIGSFVVRPVPTADPTVRVNQFSETTVQAARFRLISVRNVSDDASVPPFGFVASLTVDHYVRFQNGKRVARAADVQPGNYDPVGSYLVSVLAP